MKLFDGIWNLRPNEECFMSDTINSVNERDNGDR